MTLFIAGLLLGLLIMLMFFNKTINIKVHHVYETVTSDPNLDELETKMFTADAKRDKMYDDDKNIQDVLTEVNDVMGGSDR